MQGSSRRVPLTCGVKWGNALCVWAECMECVQCAKQCISTQLGEHGRVRAGRVPPTVRGPICPGRPALAYGAFEDLMSGAQRERFEDVAAAHRQRLARPALLLQGASPFAKTPRPMPSPAGSLQERLRAVQQKFGSASDARVSSIGARR